MKTCCAGAELDTERPLQDNSQAERFECLEEERFARSIVADSEHDVIKHEFSLTCAGLRETELKLDNETHVGYLDPPSIDRAYTKRR